MPVTISALGYNSVTLTSYSTDKPNIVRLTQKIFELEEVTVNDKSLRNERKANMKLFKSEFLGLTPNAAQCEILNENDISFNYGTDDDTLKVFAARPLIIENRALGYRITYYLDNFELIKRSKACSFSGNIIFDKDLSENSANSRIYENRRREAYKGSRMHFFRSLFINKLDVNGFAIKNQFNKDLNNMELITGKDSVYKSLNYKKMIGICFNTTSPISYLELLEGSVSFDKNGFFDPLSVQWRGEMARHRIADWLPYEYEPRD